MTFTPNNWTAVNSVTDVLGFANDNTGSWFWFGMNVMVFLVILLTLAGSFGWEAGLLVASFVGILLSIIFVYMGLIAIQYVGIYVGIVILLILYIMWSNKYD